MTIYVPTWLYIKQHNVTGLKYFGKTIQDPYTYGGSGTRWKNHLCIHGDDVTTVWCQLFDTKESLVNYALAFSSENNIVESKDWANLKPENGLDGNPPGIILSEEWKRKIGEANTGEGNSFYGKSHTEESKIAIRESRARYWNDPENRKKQGAISSTRTQGELNPMFGRTQSEETKQKMLKPNPKPMARKLRKFLPKFENL